MKARRIIRLLGWAVTREAELDALEMECRMLTNSVRSTAEAHELLRKTHYVYTETHWCPGEDSMTETPWVTNDFDTVEELIDEFTKEMEE